MCFASDMLPTSALDNHARHELQTVIVRTGMFPRGAPLHLDIIYKYLIFGYVFTRKLEMRIR